MIHLKEAQKTKFKDSTRIELRGYAKELGISDEIPESADAATLRNACLRALGLTSDNAPVPRQQKQQGKGRAKERSKERGKGAALGHGASSRAVAARRNRAVAADQPPPGAPSPGSSRLAPAAVTCTTQARCGSAAHRLGCT